MIVKKKRATISSLSSTQTIVNKRKGQQCHHRHPHKIPPRAATNAVHRARSPQTKRRGGGSDVGAPSRSAGRWPPAAMGGTVLPKDEATLAAGAWPFSECDSCQTNAKRSRSAGVANIVVPVVASSHSSAGSWPQPCRRRRARAGPPTASISSAGEPTSAGSLCGPDRPFPSRPSAPSAPHRPDGISPCRD